MFAILQAPAIGSNLHAPPEDENGNNNELYNVVRIPVVSQGMSVAHGGDIFIEVVGISSRGEEIPGMNCRFREAELQKEYWLTVGISTGRYRHTMAVCVDLSS